MSAAKTKFVPTLRFPEFTEPWKTGRVDSFAKRVIKPVTVEPDCMYRQIGVRSHGKGIFHKEPVTGKSLGDKRVFWVHPQAFVVNIVFGWEQAVALTSTAEDGFIASHRFPMFVPVENKANLNFLLLFFLRRRGKYLLELASPGGAGRNKTLGQNEFAKLAMTLPPLPEQQKIVAFIGAVDNKLEALHLKHDQLKTFKRGLVQRIFSGVVRFKRDKNNVTFPDWEKKSLGDLAQIRTNKNSTLSCDRVLTNSAAHGIIEQRDFFNKEIAHIENTNGYYLVESGDYVYNPRISITSPVGPVNKNRIGTGIISPLYTVFRFSSEKNDFYDYYFHSTLWHKYMGSVANYGARHDRMSISNKDFLAIPLPHPHPDEQQKIIDFFAAIDAKIDAVACQIEKMKQFKKGLLQQMFV